MESSWWGMGGRSWVFRLVSRTASMGARRGAPRWAFRTTRPSRHWPASRRRRHCSLTATAGTSTRQPTAELVGRFTAERCEIELDKPTLGLEFKRQVKPRDESLRTRFLTCYRKT